MADGNLSLEVEDEDDAELRVEHDLNSPKAPGAEYNGADGDAGMGLSLGPVDDEDDDDLQVTPNTKRDQMDINSPRHKSAQNNWTVDNGSNNSNSGGALAGLVTQVARDDGNKQSGAESLVTQVHRPADNTEANIQKQQKAAETGGWFSALMCCCSGPKAPEPEPVQMQQTKNPANGPSDGATNPTKTKSKAATNETATSKLLDQSGQRENKDCEDSQSSTEYDGALMPPLKPEHIGKKCLILDLDETLVHSSFKPIDKPDFVIPVEIERVVHHVYVLKRPFVDEFLLRCSKFYEIVIFTASLSKYADPLLDKLDIHNVITHRLFRESCVIHGTAYVKDLRKLGRKLKDSIIVDNSPPSYLFQPTNAVPIASWFDDQTDTQLREFCPVLETTLDQIDDVRKILDANNKSFRWLCAQSEQPLSKFTVRNDLVNRN